MRTLPARLLAVTERSAVDAPDVAGQKLLDTLDRLLGAGVRWVWFRERDMAPGPRHALGRAVAMRVRAQGGFLTVGGDPALAADLRADGVHLSGGSTPDALAHARKLLPNGLLGVSAHGIAEFAAAARAGAHYATLSPIFLSASKPGYGPALGTTALTEAASSGLPVVALGGIGADRVAECRAAGAAGVAVMGPLMRGSDPEGQARRFLACEDPGDGAPSR